MQMSFNGLDLLKQWEGSVMRDGLHRVYDDETGNEVLEGEQYLGYLTIGYGHLLNRSEIRSEQIIIDGTKCSIWDGITEKEALWLLGEDVTWAEDAVNDNVLVPLTQTQFEALVSFTFNVGESAFKNSTLLKRLNQGLYEDVPTQLRRWNRSGGRIVEGLINRREKEIDQFLA